MKGALRCEDNLRAVRTNIRIKDAEVSLLTCIYSSCPCICVSVRLCLHRWVRKWPGMSLGSVR